MASLVQQPYMSQALARIVKPHPRTLAKGQEFWRRLVANAERVETVEELDEEFRDHIRETLEAGK